MQSNCIICGASFEKRRKAITCSAECSRARRLIRGRAYKQAQLDERGRRGTRHGEGKQYHPKPKKQGVCRECGSSFLTHYDFRLFCSSACKSRWHERDRIRDLAQKREADRRYRREVLYPPTSKPCAQCGGMFTTTKPRRVKFCSEQCRREHGKRQAREYSHRRRVRLLEAGEFSISLRDERRLINRFSGQCAYCEVREATQIDHVIPVARGGTHAIGNLLPCCGLCNRQKSDRLLIEWRAGRSSPRYAAA